MDTVITYSSKRSIFRPTCLIFLTQRGDWFNFAGKNDFAPIELGFQSLCRGEQENAGKNSGQTRLIKVESYCGWSEIRGIQSFRFTTLPRGAKQGLGIAGSARAAERDKSESLHLSRNRGHAWKPNCLSVAGVIKLTASRLVKSNRREILRSARK